MRKLTTLVVKALEFISERHEEKRVVFRDAGALNWKEAAFHTHKLWKGEVEKVKCLEVELNHSRDTVEALRANIDARWKDIDALIGDQAALETAEKHIKCLQEGERASDAWIAKLQAKVVALRDEVSAKGAVIIDRNALVAKLRVEIDRLRAKQGDCVDQCVEVIDLRAQLQEMAESAKSYQDLYSKALGKLSKMQDFEEEAAALEQILSAFKAQLDPRDFKRIASTAAPFPLANLEPTAEETS